MEQGATDASVTELLGGVDFRNANDESCSRNGFVKPYKNGYTKVSFAGDVPSPN